MVLNDLDRIILIIVGIGADIRTGKDTYFWLDLERSFGHDISRTWQINGGFSWQWK